MNSVSRVSNSSADEPFAFFLSFLLEIWSLTEGNDHKLKMLVALAQHPHRDPKHGTLKETP